MNWKCKTFREKWKYDKRRKLKKIQGGDQKVQGEIKSMEGGRKEGKESKEMEEV